MKYLLVLAVALAACGNKNDLPILQHEAATLAKFYKPRLDTLDARVLAIMDRGRTIPADFPGVKEVGMQLQEARDTIVQLKSIVQPGPDQKSAVEKQADAAAKASKLADLQKLLHDTEAMLERGMTIIQDDLLAVEGWIAQYDRKLLAMAPAPAAEQPSGQPGAPEAPAPAQPPAGAQPPGAQPAAPAQPAPPKQ